MLKVQDINSQLAALNYEEPLLEFAALETALSLVPDAGEAPPEFYLSLDGGQSSIPLTKSAVTRFGVLSGIKPSIYREFVKNEALTAQMIHYSLHRPHRGGYVYVARTENCVLGFHPAEKPHIGVQYAWNVLQAVGGDVADMRMNEKGGMEFTLILGDATDSVRPGLFLLHDGRPRIGVCLMLHDQSLICSPLRASSMRKDADKAQQSLSKLVDATANQAAGAATHVYNLANETVKDPPKFLSRLGSTAGFSAKVLNRVVAGAGEVLNPGASMYDLVRYVASLANRKDGAIDRRYQEFGYHVAFHGMSVCSACGLPH